MFPCNSIQPLFKNQPHIDSLVLTALCSAKEDRSWQSISSHAWLYPASSSSLWRVSAAASDGFGSHERHPSHTGKSAAVFRPRGPPQATSRAWCCWASPGGARYAHTNEDRWGSASGSAPQWSGRSDPCAFRPVRTPCTYLDKPVEIKRRCNF